MTTLSELVLRNIRCASGHLSEYGADIGFVLVPDEKSVESQYRSILKRLHWNGWTEEKLRNRFVPTKDMRGRDKMVDYRKGFVMCPDIDGKGDKWPIMERQDRALPEMRVTCHVCRKCKYHEVRKHRGRKTRICALWRKYWEKEGGPL